MPLGMTALEIVLFVTPRVFLLIAGPVRIQKIRLKPKVRSAVFSSHLLLHMWSGTVDHIPLLGETETPGQRAAGVVSRHVVGGAFRCRSPACLTQ